VGRTLDLGKRTKEHYTVLDKKGQLMEIGVKNLLIYSILRLDLHRCNIRVYYRRRRIESSLHVRTAARPPSGYAPVKRPCIPMCANNVCCFLSS
jgi:hypothetical protein